MIDVKISSCNASVDLSGLDNGLYILELHTDSGIMRKKDNTKVIAYFCRMEKYRI